MDTKYNEEIQKVKSIIRVRDIKEMMDEEQYKLRIVNI